MFFYLSSKYLKKSSFIFSNLFASDSSFSFVLNTLPLYGKVPFSESSTMSSLAFFWRF